MVDIFGLYPSLAQSSALPPGVRLHPVSFFDIAPERIDIRRVFNISFVYLHRLIHVQYKAMYYNH